MSPALSRTWATVRATPAATLATVGLAAAVVWAFWPTLLHLARRWQVDPRYAHGYLVPLFCLYLLWWRRDKLDPRACGSSWVGLVLVALGLGVRFVGTYFYHEWFGAAGIIPCAAGLVLLAGGWPAFRWAWPAVAFLAFMLTLPYRLEVALANPLQRVATLVSTYALQTLGFVAVAEGNTIRMGDVRLGVVEACSGLSMLVIFIALSTAVAIVVRRPAYERALIVLAAVPIALAANITRITVTGILHKTAGSEVADYVFHDLAGWLMMPLALAYLWAGLTVLGWVVVDDDLTRGHGRRRAIQTAPPSGPVTPLGIPNAPDGTAPAPAAGK